jgi:hypothetical protein
MALWPNFIGPAYLAHSPVMAAETCENLFLETIEETKNAKRQMLLGTPGLRKIISTPDGEIVCRGTFSQDGLTIAVIGAGVYRVDLSVPALYRVGTVANDLSPVSMASNGQGGQQLAIVTGGELKILNLLTMVLSATIALPLTNVPQVVRYMDGYFLLTEKNTLRVWFSALEDGTSWNALDFFAVSLQSTNVVGIEVLADRLWVFQTQTSVVYYDTGDTDNPFQPYPSTVMQEGATSPWAITVVGETVMWLSQDNQGHARVVKATTPNPQKVSTPAIDYSLAQADTLLTAEMLAYEQQGHTMCALTVPNLTAHGWTWCYDDTESAWHRRFSWIGASATKTRWRARGLCNADGVLLCGDYQTGNLYALDLDTYTENDEPLPWERTAPYLSAENQILVMDQIELGVEAGVGLPSGQGSDPTMWLTLSDDGARTFGPPIDTTYGAQSDYNDRAVWTRCGQAMANKLVARISGSDPVKRAFGPGLYLRAQAGTGQY